MSSGRMIYGVAISSPDRVTPFRIPGPLKTWKAWDVAEEKTQIAIPGHILFAHVPPCPHPILIVFVINRIIMSIFLLSVSIIIILVIMIISIRKLIATRSPADHPARCEGGHRRNARRKEDPWLRALRQGDEYNVVGNTTEKVI